jgi:lysine-specific demethylase/histidyl-hydroxylase NO66
MQEKHLNFRLLLDPLPVEVFFAEHLGDAPAYVGGAAEKVEGLFGWDDVTALLNNHKIWTGETLRLFENGNPLPPERYGYHGTNRDLRPVSRPLSEKVLAALSGGAEMRLEQIESLDPGLKRLAAAVASALGGPAMIRAHCGGKAALSNTLDYDAEDSFHLQLDGTTMWALYEERVGPVEPEGPGELIGELEMAPGDLLYLPSGQLRRSAVSGDRALWLAITVRRPNALDIISEMRAALLDQTPFRAFLPRHDAIDDHRAALAGLAGEIETAFAGEGFAEAVAAAERRCAEFYRHAEFRLPAHDPLMLYRARYPITVPSGLDGAVRAAAEWVCETEVFTADDFGAHFPAGAALLDALQESGMVEPADGGLPRAKPSGEELT